MEPLKVKFNWTLRKQHDKRVETQTETESEKSVKSAAAKSRQKKKLLDPDKYKEDLQKDAMRKREAYKQSVILRAKLSETDRDAERQQWAIAKQTQREKKKHLGTAQKSPAKKSKHIKDMTYEEKKNYMTMKKRQSRSNMNKQKTTNTNDRETIQRRQSRKTETDDRASTKQKETMQKQSKMTEPIIRAAENVCTTGLKLPPSRTTVYRQTKAMRKTLPTSPKRFANVITTLIDNASSMKQAAMAKRGIKRKIDEEFLVPPLKKTILELKTNMNEVKRRQYNVIASASMRAAHSGIKSKLASALGIGHRTRRKLTKNAHNPIPSRKKRKDVIDKSTVEKVQDHWTSEGISTKHTTWQRSRLGI